MPTGTTTTIDVNGTILSAFPATETYDLGATVSLVPMIDPLYRFDYWNSDSVVLIPNATNLNASFYVSNNDTIILHISLIPPTR